MVFVLISISAIDLSILHEWRGVKKSCNNFFPSSTVMLN